MNGHVFQQHDAHNGSMTTTNAPLPPPPVGFPHPLPPPSSTSITTTIQNHSVVGPVPLWHNNYITGHVAYIDNNALAEAAAHASMAGTEFRIARQFWPRHWGVPKEDNSPPTNPEEIAQGLGAIWALRFIPFPAIPTNFSSSSSSLSFSSSSSSSSSSFSSSSSSSTSSFSSSSSSSFSSSSSSATSSSSSSATSSSDVEWVPIQQERNRRPFHLKKEEITTPSISEL
jgi:hypothetical protein